MIALSDASLSTFRNQDRALAGRDLWSTSRLVRLDAHRVPGGGGVVHAPQAQQREHEHRASLRVVVTSAGTPVVRAAAILARRPAGGAEHGAGAAPVERMRPARGTRRTRRPVRASRALVGLRLIRAAGQPPVAAREPLAEMLAAVLLAPLQRLVAPERLVLLLEAQAAVDRFDLPVRDVAQEVEGGCPAGACPSNSKFWQYRYCAPSP